jgi:hypothetical protein
LRFEIHESNLDVASIMLIRERIVKKSVIETVECCASVTFPAHPSFLDVVALGCGSPSVGLEPTHSPGKFRPGSNQGNTLKRGSTLDN